MENAAVNKRVRRIAEFRSGIFQAAFAVFAVITFAFAKLMLADTSAEIPLSILAVVEFLCSCAMFVYAYVNSRNRLRELSSYIETLTYDSENAKNKTLLSFPMPLVVFTLEDTRIIWGNEMFFSICGEAGKRLDARVSDLVEDFSSKWLSEGKTQYPGLIDLNGRRYRVHGNIVRTDSGDENGNAFMCVTYWIDVTDYDNIKTEYEKSRPVAGVLVIDNYEELIKNLPDREKNDARDAIEDKLSELSAGCGGIIRRYDRDRYLMLAEKRNLEAMKKERFPILEKIHSVESPNGVTASIAAGFGEDAGSMAEALQFADMASELALTRGGDQAVIKNTRSFEFFGGRGGGENEKRSRVRSRVMANTLSELIKDSSRVFIMGHRYADLDCIGAAAGINCLARKLGVRCSIVADDLSVCESLVKYMKKRPEYGAAFIDTQEALIHADGRTLLVITDTNRPDQVELPDLLDACGRVAVIDHHRASASYIHNAALGYIEPSASSCCELVSDILTETIDQADIFKEEADALLAGIVLDTKNFTIRTGENTFDSASYLRHCGADTAEVKKLLQGNIEDTVQKYKVLQTAELYRDDIVIAAPEFPIARIVAAKAADELLNISGVEASIIVAPGENGGTFASARSIGEVNVQLIMEKVGGGGNRNAAAAQFPDKEISEAAVMVRAAVDAYLEQS